MGGEQAKAVFQCAPNFSEGRRQEVVAAIAQAIRETPGARLINASADADHNRCVMTFLGDAPALHAAALAAARIAVTRIDLREHRGVHPRAGALDVLPVAPLRHAGRAEAVAIARAIGQDIAGELRVPVYFYEWAAEPGRESALPELRRGGFEAFAARELVGKLAPDAGPHRAHPTAGIAVVGARGPLVAYNILLDTPDAAIARAIARRIRAERERIPELEGVRALGLFLASRQKAQVSLNLTRPDRSPLPAVFAFVEDEAARRGVTVRESEIIGAIPRAALGGLPPEAIRWRSFDPAQILETWLV